MEHGGDEYSVGVVFVASGFADSVTARGIFKVGTIVVDEFLSLEGC